MPPLKQIQVCQSHVDAGQLFGVVHIVSEVPHLGLIGVYSILQGEK